MEFNNIQEYSDYFEQVKEITNNYFDKYKSELKIPENFEGSFRNAFQHAFGTVIIAQELGIDDALFLCYAKEIRTKQGEIDAHKNGRSDKVRRLGFNPTSKGRKSKIELKKTA